MDCTIGAATMGQRLGAESAEQLVQRAELVCGWERKRIALTNEGAIAARKAEYAVAVKEAQLLKEHLYHSEPICRQRLLHRKIVIFWVVALVLIGSGFVLSLLTLEPYRLGLKGVLYCVGIAIVAPFLVHHSLDLFSNETLKRLVTVLSCLAALASVVLLAAVRGNLLAQQVRQESAAVVIDGEEPSTGTSKNSFYEDTVPLIQLVMALLALAMEAGAGIASHEAQRLSAALETDSKTLSEQLSVAHARLAVLVEEIVNRQNEAGLFEAQFWRDFYWSMLQGTVAKAAKRFVLPALLMLLFYPTLSRAQQSVDLVVALDLTKSTDQAGPDGRTQFDKNVKGVAQLLARLPAGTEVTIIGITGKSFAQPYLLLRAKLSLAPGFFGEKLSRGRQEIVIAWKKRSERLRPKFTETDILGAFELASELLSKRGDSSRKVLILYSDMRQATSELNLETAKPLVAVLAKFQAVGGRAVPNLQDVEVYILGAVASNRNSIEWRELRTFWTAYVERAGGRLTCYSVLSDPPGPHISGQFESGTCRAPL